MVGCSSSSNDSSSGNEDTSNDGTSETDTDATKVNKTLSGNVMATQSDSFYEAFGTSINTRYVKTITFLDSFDALPFEIDSDTLSFDISEDGNGCVMLYADYSQDDEMYDLYVVGEGGVDANPDSHRLFQYFTNCISINFNDCFFTSNVTDMNYMFFRCYELLDLDLSSFDTSNVTDMSWMFCSCSSLISLDVSNFDISDSTNTSGMYVDCSALLITKNSDEDSNDSIFGSEVAKKSSGNFIASFSIDTMNYAFGTSIGATAVKTVTFLESKDSLPDGAVFARDISGNNLGDVILYYIYSQSNGMYDMYIVGEGGVDANASSGYLFANFSNCSSINFNDCFYTSNATDMSSMFYNCESLTSLDLSNFDTSNVTDMSGMFNWCESLNSLDVSNIDTLKVTDMRDMFRECKSLTSLDLSSFDTSSVTDVGYMFFNCKSLTNLEIGNLDMSNVTTNVLMFDNCPAGDDY